MKKSDAPNFEQLIDWLEGRLSEEEARQVATQASAANPAVQAEIAWLRTFYQASRDIVSAEPPPAIAERLQRRFAAFTQGRRHFPRWQRLVATLSFDSHAQLAMGVRTAALSESQRQVVYSTDQATVVLTLQRRNRDSRIDLLGQVLLTDESDADLVRVSLFQEEEVDSTITDDLGEFTLTALPLGLYDLVLSGGQFEITISAVDLSL